MPVIYGATTDGNVGKSATGGPSWSDIRDAGTGSIIRATSTRRSTAVLVAASTSRGGNYTVYRSYYAFDTSSITANVASATINIFGYFLFTLADGLIAVKATKPDLSTNLAAADYDAIDGFVAGASMSGNATDYTAKVTSWNTSAYNSITLTSDALADLKNQSVFSVAFVDHAYDYLNVDPGTSLGTKRAGMYYAEYTGTSRDPFIDYTLAAGGYGNNVNGVASANIGSVIGVATANIDKINGV